MRKLLFICICFVSVNGWATLNLVPNSAHTVSIGTSLLPFNTAYADAYQGDGSQLKLKRYYNVSIDTPVVSAATMETMPSTFTVLRISARVRVAPVTTSLTINVSSTTLMPASVGTLTIAATKTQSNALSPNLVLPMDRDLIYTVTGTGTSPDLGFDISISHTLLEQ